MQAQAARVSLPILSSWILNLGDVSASGRVGVGFLSGE